MRHLLLIQPDPHARACVMRQVRTIFSHCRVTIDQADLAVTSLLLSHTTRYEGIIVSAHLPHIKLGVFLRQLRRLHPMVPILVVGQAGGELAEINRAGLPIVSLGDPLDGAAVRSHFPSLRYRNQHVKAAAVWQRRWWHDRQARPLLPSLRASHVRSPNLS